MDNANYQVYVNIGCYVATVEEAEAIVKDCRERLPYIDFDDSRIIDER